MILAKFPFQRKEWGEYFKIDCLTADYKEVNCGYKFQFNEAEVNKIFVEHIPRIISNYYLLIHLFTRLLCLLIIEI